MDLKNWFKSVREFIPPGFDPDSYAACEQYDVRQWFYEAQWRFIKQESKDEEFSCINPFNEEQLAREAECCGEEINLVTEPYSIRQMRFRDVVDLKYYLETSTYFRPLLPLYGEAKRIKENDIILNERGRKSRKSTSPLNDQEIDEYKRLLTLAGEDQHARETIPLLKALQAFDRGFSDYPAYPAIALLMADMEAPDEVLRRDFDAWLKDARKAWEGLHPFSVPRRSKAVISGRLLKSLATNRVLQYLDVSLWLINSKKKMPKDHEWPYIIFPFKGGTSYGYSSDNFKKLTVKQAKWLISDGLHLLRYCIADIARQPVDATARKDPGEEINLFDRFSLARRSRRTKD